MVSPLSEVRVVGEEQKTLSEQQKTGTTGSVPQSKPNHPYHHLTFFSIFDPTYMHTVLLPYLELESRELALKRDLTKKDLTLRGGLGDRKMEKIGEAVT